MRAAAAEACDVAIGTDLYMLQRPTDACVLSVDSLSRDFVYKH